MANTPEVKHTLTRNEAMEKLSVPGELFDSLVRQERLRVWAYYEPYEQYYPVKKEGALALLESADKNQTVFCDLDLIGAEAKIDAFNRKQNEMESPKLTYDLMRFAPYEMEALVPKDFRFTSGFKKVWFHGQEVAPTETQSLIIQCLWEQFLKGQPEVDEKDAYKYVDSLQGTKRLHKHLQEVISACGSDRLIRQKTLSPESLIWSDTAQILSRYNTK